MSLTGKNKTETACFQCGSTDFWHGFHSLFIDEANNPNSATFTCPTISHKGTLCCHHLPQRQHLPSLFIRQNLIHRRPPEVAVGDVGSFFAVCEVPVAFETEGNLPNVPRIRRRSVPGCDLIREGRLAVDEVLGGVGADRVVDLGRDPPVEVVVGEGNGDVGRFEGRAGFDLGRAVAVVPGVFDGVGRFDVQKLAASPFRRLFRRSISVATHRSRHHEVDASPFGYSARTISSICAIFPS